MWKAGERDLGGAGRGRGRRSRARRCSTSSVGKKPVPYIASSRTSTGGSIGHVAVRGGAVEREAVEREREQRRVADAGSRSASPRRAPRAPCSKRPTSVCSGPVELRRIADAAHLDASSSVSPSGAVGSGGFGTTSSSASRSASAAASSSSAARSSSFTPPSSSSCSGVGLPLSFSCRAARRPAAASARQRSSAASSSSNASAAPLRASAARNASGVGAGGAEVDHGRECSESASSTCATPSSAAGGQIQSADRLHPLVRVLDRDAVAGPLQQLDVVLAVAERDRLARA